MINILTNMVNVLKNTISPFRSTYSTVTNGNNFLTIHHKKLMHTSKVCFSQSRVYFFDLRRKEDLHPWVRVDHAEGLCHHEHLAFWYSLLETVFTVLYLWVRFEVAGRCLFY